MRGQSDIFHGLWRRGIISRWSWNIYSRRSIKGDIRCGLICGKIPSPWVRVLKGRPLPSLSEEERRKKCFLQNKSFRRRWAFLSAWFVKSAFFLCAFFVCLFCLFFALVCLCVCVSVHTSGAGLVVKGCSTEGQCCWALCTRRVCGRFAFSCVVVGRFVWLRRPLCYLRYEEIPNPTPREVTGLCASAGSLSYEVGL